MRIYIAIKHARHGRAYYGDLWSSNFYPALRAMGHELIESTVDLLPASRFMGRGCDFNDQELSIRGEITQRMVDEITGHHRERPIDLFLSYFYNSHFDPAGFESVHGLGIRTVNFYCNSMYQFGLVNAIAPAVNHAWHAEKPARQNYLDVGANPIWVQMGGDPQVYRPITGVERDGSACFIGQSYADREILLGALVKADVPVAIYGNGWVVPGISPVSVETQVSSAAQPAAETEQCKSASGDGVARVGMALGEPAAAIKMERKSLGPGSVGSYANVVASYFRGEGLIGGTSRLVRHTRHRLAARRLRPLLARHAYGRLPGLDDMRRAYARHGVALNFSNVWGDGRPGSGLIAHVRLRDFEAPLCRACYLTGYSEEIEEFYKLGEEIDVYRDAEELVDKTRYYLTHPDQADALREAGYQRALRDHTWERRFEQLFRAIGLCERGEA